MTTNETRPYELTLVDIIATFILNALASFIISLALLTLLIKLNVIRWRVLHDALDFVLNPSKYEATRRKRRNSIMRAHDQIRCVGESAVLDDAGTYVDLRRRGEDDEDLPDFARSNARVSRQIQFGAVRGRENDSDITMRPTKLENWNMNNRPSENFKV